MLFISIVFVIVISLILITGDDSINDDNSNSTYNNLSIFLTTAAFAQPTNSNNTQLWIDKENNAKIVFTYNPESPIIGKPTNLLFTIQNLRTGDQIAEDLHARIIITNGLDILKITNSTFPGGNFSIYHPFPDSGSYQVISKIDSKSVSELASFNVFVPSQALSSTFKSFVTLMLYYVTPITASAAAIIVYLSYKKKI